MKIQLYAITGFVAGGFKGWRNTVASHLTKEEAERQLALIREHGQGGRAVTDAKIEEMPSR